MLKVYAYRNCGTCKKALQWLKSNGVAYKELPIRDTPPTQPELKQMLRFYNGDLRRLFNTSGLDYRALDLKNKLPSITHDEAIRLLTKTGNLVKRPFALDSAASRGAIGFREEEWRQFLPTKSFNK